MIIVLCGNQGGGWHVEDLRRAANGIGVPFEARSWRSLSGNIGFSPIAAAGDVVLDDARLVLLRTMPAGTLEQIVFRMDLIGRLHAAGVNVLNPPRAIEMAVDKYLSLRCLAEAGLPVPRTVVCQTLDDAMNAFEALGEDVVIKPLFGSEGFGMTRLNDRALAQRAFAMLQNMGSAIYVQEFLNHNGSDLRLFVLGDRMLCAMRRINEHDWKTNIAVGGRAEAFTPDTALTEMAVKAAGVCQSPIAGVDILLCNGEPSVLEVNAVPGWRALSKVTGVDVSTEVLEYALQLQPN